MECEVLLAELLVEQNGIPEAHAIRNRALPLVKRILGPKHRLTSALTEPDFLNPARFDAW